LGTCCVKISKEKKIKTPFVVSCPKLLCCQKMQFSALGVKRKNLIQKFIKKNMPLNFNTMDDFYIYFLKNNLLLNGELKIWVYFYKVNFGWMLTKFWHGIWTYTSLLEIFFFNQVPRSKFILSKKIWAIQTIGHLGGHLLLKPSSTFMSHNKICQKRICFQKETNLSFQITF